MTSQAVTKALSAGCDVWVVPDLDQSLWARRIDWYLNFQFQRAELHKAQSLPAELNFILSNYEFTPPFTEPPLSEAGKSHLMVASYERLPNRKTILVSQMDSPQDWVRACSSLWVDLGRPSIRVFLPTMMSAQAFRTYWSAKESVAGVECIEDISASELDLSK